MNCQNKLDLRPHGHDMTSLSNDAQVIKANDDLTPEHHQFFLYQMLRGLKYIHTGASSHSTRSYTSPRAMRLWAATTCQYCLDAESVCEIHCIHAQLVAPCCTARYHVTMVSRAR